MLNDAECSMAAGL